MPDIKYYAEYLLTGNTTLLMEDIMCFNRTSRYVGLGTLNPTNKLVISGGTIQIINGTQTAGYVLTSDSGGTASWSNGSGLFITDINYYFDTDADRLYTPGLTVQTGFTYTGSGYNTAGNILKTDGTGAASWVSPYVTGLWTGTTTGNIYNINTGDVYITGDASIVGNLGIGNTSAPGQKLVVSGGTIQIIDGNQATGYVFTSNSTGVGSWAAPTGGSGGSRWTNVTGVTTSDTGLIVTSANQGAWILAGLPIKYTVGSTVYYGVVTGVTTTNIAVAGPTCSACTTTDVYVGNPEMVTVETFLISGSYSDAASTSLLEDDMNMYYRWQSSNAYCVRFSTIHKVNGTANTAVNVLINANNVSTANSNSGITTDIDNWNSTFTDINSSNYRIEFNKPIEIKTNMTSPDSAKDLSIQIIFVFP
jgi:hypothetical protein